MKQNEKQSSSWHNHSDGSRSGTPGDSAIEGGQPAFGAFVVEVWTFGVSFILTTSTASDRVDQCAVPFISQGPVATDIPLLPCIYAQLLAPVSSVQPYSARRLLLATQLLRIPPVSYPRQYLHNYL